MSDETKVKFLTKSYDVESGHATFTLRDGYTRTVRLDDLSAEIVRHLALHGLMQKGGDAVASCKGNTEEAREKLSAVLDALEAGQFNAGRSSGGESAPRVSQLAEAVARVKGCTVAEAVAAISALSAEQLKLLRASGKIKLAIIDIKRERAAAQLAAASDDVLEDLGV